MIFSDLALSRRLERAESIGGARFVEAVDRLSPVTQTFGLGLFAEFNDAGLDRLEAFLDERGAPVNHEVSPFAGVSLADVSWRRPFHPPGPLQRLRLDVAPDHPAQPGEEQERQCAPRRKRAQRGVTQIADHRG
jgi:hypothetical protein